MIRAAPLAIGLLTAAFAVVCVGFVRQPGLGTFADDSVSYLVMAQAMSPWQAASQAVAEAMSREAFYPPLLPLLLALSGAAHDFSLAHALQAVLVAACLPLAYVLGTRWLESDRAAVAAAVILALLPAFWINARGILSEPLYCALLLATLLVLDRAPRKLWLAALLMAALVLTRTAGSVLIGAYALWALSRRERPWPARVQALVPVAVAVLAYAAWVLVRPSATSDDYARILVERGHGYLAPGALAASLARQSQALAEAWIGSLLLFWVDGRPLRVALAGAAGLLALAGLVLRIRAGKFDGWVMAAYVATFLLWPFRDQMGRFLFPALPVLVLYAFFAAGAGLKALGRPPVLAYSLLAVLFVSLAVPGLAFIYQRSQEPGPVARIVDWYRTPDLAAAQARAQVHLELFADMDAIRRLTPPGARVMWVAPSYIALLAGRRGVAAPSAELAPPVYRNVVRASGAEYVLLSAYNPRDTIRDAAWKAGLAALRERSEIVHAGPGSLLLKLDAARLSEGDL